jgi:hypothetical protein
LSLLYHTNPVFEETSFDAAQITVLKLSEIAGMYACSSLTVSVIDHRLRQFVPQVLQQ